MIPGEDAEFRQDLRIFIRNRKFHEDGEILYRGMFSGAYTLSGRFHTSSNVRMIFELPIGHYSHEYVDFFGPRVSISETSVGNPLIGFELRGGPDGPLWEVGARLPLRAKRTTEAMFIAELLDYDRAGSYAYKYWPVFFLVHHRGVSSGGLFHAVRGGMTLLIPFGDPEGRDVYGILRLAGKLGFENEDVRLTGGLNFNCLLFESRRDFEDRVFASVEAAITAKFSAVHPGVFFRIPIDRNISDIVNAMIGIQLDFIIR